jgi:Holliday junction resolvasome RuvABC endonuclease subunit
MLKNKIKILAIDPGTKHMGFASFEDIELVDHGVKTIQQGSEKIILSHLHTVFNRMIEEKKPDYLILERNSFSQIRLNIRLARAVSIMRYIAQRHGIQVYEYDLRTVRKEICNDGNASKKRVAEALITTFDELKVYLKSDKAWALRYYMNIIDAVAVGMTFVKLHISDIRPVSRWKFWKSPDSNRDFRNTAN